MDPWKWDYSKTFARFLLSFSTFCRDSFVLSRIMTRRVAYGSSAVAFTEVRLASVSTFCPSFFRQFNCCANICPAAIDPDPGANTITSKVRCTLISFPSLPPSFPFSILPRSRKLFRWQRYSSFPPRIFAGCRGKRNCVERDTLLKSWGENPRNAGSSLRASVDKEHCGALQQRGWFANNADSSYSVLRKVGERGRWRNEIVIWCISSECGTAVNEILAGWKLQFCFISRGCCCMKVSGIRDFMARSDYGLLHDFFRIAVKETLFVRRVCFL